MVIINKFRLKTSDTVFILVDIQEKLMKTMDYREKIYKNHNILMTLAKQLSIPVIKCEQYPEGLGSTVTEVRELLPENHFSIKKLTFSGYNEDMGNILQELKCKTIIISGTETHVCVYQTARDLLAAGYKVHVVRDGVCSRFKENYINGLDLMKSMGAVITNTETIAFDMLQRAGSSDFKVVSKVIK